MFEIQLLCIYNIIFYSLPSRHVYRAYATFEVKSNTFQVDTVSTSNIDTNKVFPIDNKIVYTLKM